MTKKELLKLKMVLAKIKNPDDDVRLCQAYVDKQIAVYEACKGQIKDNYEYPEINW